MKKMLAIAMAMTMGLGLVACGGGNDASSSSASEPATEDSAQTEEGDAAEGSESDAAQGEAPEETPSAGAEYTVGICQLVQHDALDAATQGFKDALTEELGEAVAFDEQNAQNDSNTCSTIINGFVSSGVDLILANATPALQAALMISLTEYLWIAAARSTVSLLPNKIRRMIYDKKLRKA